MRKTIAIFLFLVFSSDLLADDLELRGISGVRVKAWMTTPVHQAGLTAEQLQNQIRSILNEYSIRIFSSEESDVPVLWFIAEAFLYDFRSDTEAVYHLRSEIRLSEMGYIPRYSANQKMLLADRVISWETPGNNSIGYKTHLKAKVLESVQKETHAFAKAYLSVNQ